MVVDKAIVHNYSVHEANGSDEDLYSHHVQRPRSKLECLLLKGVYEHSGSSHRPKKQLGGDGEVVLQVGGNDIATMADASVIARQFGYKEVNINCGCPRCAQKLVTI